MTAPLDKIHRDPNILNRAIARRQLLASVAAGEVAAPLLSKAALGVEEARRVMRERFAALDWEFTVGRLMSRDERNTRG